MTMLKDMMPFCVRVGVYCAIRAHEVFRRGERQQSPQGGRPHRVFFVAGFLILCLKADAVILTLLLNQAVDIAW